jgi:CBS domain-containing protein
MEGFVKEIMKNQVITIDSSLTVKDAAKKMEEAGIGCVVVTEKDRSVGILTERDFVRKIVAKEKPVSTPIREVMSSPLIVIDPESTIWELAEIMKEKKIHRVPVVHEGRPVGIVSATDITSVCSLGSDSGMKKICQQILLRLSPT